MEQLPPRESSPVSVAGSETNTGLAIPHLEFKVALLLALTLILSTAFVAYVLYARGVFDTTQRVVLVADESDGVNVGMQLTFKGFSIGRVRHIELDKDARVRIHIDVPEKDARWLRVSSVFIIERSLVGGVRIRAVTGLLEDAPLPDGAVRNALRGDATEEIPGLVLSIKSLLANLDHMTAAESSLSASLDSIRGVTGRMAGRSGVLGGVLGGEENAKKVFNALDRANTLLDSVAGLTAKIAGLTAKVDGSLAKADQQLFGPGGVMTETQKAVQQLNTLLGEARDSLKRVDAVLAEAQKIGSNASTATDDLATLRAEVDASLRKVGGLIDEINRKWPFSRDTELKLP